MPSCAVTSAVITVLPPAVRFTWWSAVLASASAGVTTALALAWVGVAVTVVDSTLLATLAV